MYAVTVLRGTCREYHIEDMLAGACVEDKETVPCPYGFWSQEYKETLEKVEFTIFDTLDESDESQRAHMVHLADLMQGLRCPIVGRHMSEELEFQRFNNFKACTGQDKYINSFLEILHKLEKPSVPLGPKECAHSSRRLRKN